MDLRHNGVSWNKKDDGSMWWWNGTEWVYWDSQNVQHPAPPPSFFDAAAPAFTPVAAATPGYQGPARTAHGLGYWLFVGWWLGPLMWMGRVALWLFAWPLGLWRSLVHGRKTSEAKARRGAR